MKLFMQLGELNGEYTLHSIKIGGGAFGHSSLGVTTPQVHYSAGALVRGFNTPQVQLAHL